MRIQSFTQLSRRRRDKRRVDLSPLSHPESSGRDLDARNEAKGRRGRKLTSTSAIHFTSAPFRESFVRHQYSRKELGTRPRAPALLLFFPTFRAARILYNQLYGRSARRVCRSGDSNRDSISKLKRVRSRNSTVRNTSARRNSPYS